MVWKQDLAKLKQELKEGEGSPPPPPPKPKPKPLELKPMEDEDALFLSAMGVKRPAPVRNVPGPAAAAPPPIAAPAPAPDFAEALKDLKGLKPMAANPVLARPEVPALPEPKPAAPPAVPKAAEASLPAVPQPPPELPKPEPRPEPAPGRPSAPVRIQLAAGMAVDVDGSLDLRHHSVRDAVERLKDRLADAVHLSWRTLHLTLGPEPELHEAVLALLTEGTLPVSRYAQAPIPLGGAQAWILYLSHPEA